MKRRLWTTAGFVLLLCLAGARATDAQVSCSPEIPGDTCKEVAVLFEGFLTLETGVKGGSQLELVSPAEFRARINQIKRKYLTEVESEMPPGCGSASVKLVFGNCWNENVVFFRDNPNDLAPKRILVSSDAVVFKNRTSESGILTLLYFVRGYYEGLLAEQRRENCSGSSPTRNSDMCQ
jgi:hypothetical protein